MPASSYGQYSTEQKRSIKPLFTFFSNEPIDKKMTPAMFQPGYHLPFFCRIEHELEKETKMAFRFRLGNLDYVNTLENKK